MGTSQFGKSIPKTNDNTRVWNRVSARKIEPKCDIEQGLLILAFTLGFKTLIKSVMYKNGMLLNY
ncbi:hypothetical protein BI334_03885 [Moorena producens 3L]|nr:hypothetical protein BI334_03885 [Moorena producens 3L]